MHLNTDLLFILIVLYCKSHYKLTTGRHERSGRQNKTLFHIMSITFS